MERLEARVDRLAEAQAEQATEIALLRQTVRDIRLLMIVLIAVEVLRTFTPLLSVGG